MTGQSIHIVTLNGPLNETIDYELSPFEEFYCVVDTVSQTVGQDPFVGHRPLFMGLCPFLFLQKKSNLKRWKTF